MEEITAKWQRKFHRCFQFDHLQTLLFWCLSVASISTTGGARVQTSRVQLGSRFASLLKKKSAISLQKKGGAESGEGFTLIIHIEAPPALPLPPVGDFPAAIAAVTPSHSGRHTVILSTSVKLTALMLQHAVPLECRECSYRPTHDTEMTAEL